MSETVNLIPSRLKNAATNGHVAGVVVIQLVNNNNKIKEYGTRKKYNYSSW